MKILKTNIADLEKSPLMLYKLTKSRATKSISKLTDEELDKVYDVLAYCEYEDVNTKGETVTILSIMVDADLVLAAQSATFRASFADILDVVGDSNFKIRILTDVSKSGRKYMDCDLADVG